MGSSLELLAGMSPGGILVVLIVGIAVGALVLSGAFRLVIGYLPGYVPALGTVALTGIATGVIALLLELVAPVSLNGPGTAVALFLVGAWAINYLLRTRTGLQLGFGKACLVQLVYMVIGFVVALVSGLLLAMLSGSMVLRLH